MAFIICLTSAVSISFALHPAAPTSVRDAPLDHLQITMAASFILGIAAMLGSIGISGWIRSRALGVFTSVIAAIGLLLFTVLHPRLRIGLANGDDGSDAVEGRTESLPEGQV